MNRFKRYERYKDSGIEWIGEIPEHWNISKLKYLTYCLDGKRIPLSSEQRGEMQGDIPYWGANCIIDYVNDWIIDGEVVLLGEDGAPFFDKNKDVAFYSNEKIWPNNHVHVLRALQSINAKLLTYILNTVDYRNYINGSTRDKLTQSEMKNILIQLPSAQEQKAIANFLDQKTAEIDGLIADKEKLNELLQEKRQAIITEAVTKGLNPNVRMKDSGIEWIGEIPEHWKVTKVKYYYDVCLGKMIQPNQEDYSDTLEYYLCAINVTWDGIDISNLKEMWFSNEDKKKYSIKSGDLIVCEGGDAGRASIWDGSVENCYIQNAVHRVREKKSSSNKYLYYWLYFLKHAGYTDLICNKATIMHYTYEKFLNTILVLPDLDEQRKIVYYLDEKIAEINSLKKEIEEQLQKLKEYRQSLISEAVTGKIDVREFENKDGVIYSE